MGKVASKISRSTVKNFNIENRAHRVIERTQKGRIELAPKHESTKESLEALKREHPEWLEAQKIKHDGLHDRLKGLVVNPDKFGELTTKRRLPESRAVAEDTEFGYLEPSFIRPGRCSIRQTLEFISKHQDSPEKYTADNVAADYKLDRAVVTDVLKYFQTFQILLPKEVMDELGVVTPDKATLNAPSRKSILSGEKP